MNPRERFGVPANTVKTHLRRALLEMRASMATSAGSRPHATA